MLVTEPSMPLPERMEKIGSRGLQQTPRESLLTPLYGQDLKSQGKGQRDLPEADSSHQVELGTWFRSGFLPAPASGDAMLGSLGEGQKWTEDLSWDR